jgi:hypothetical protein
MSRFNLAKPKPFDLKDPYNYLPDQDTIGTEAYYKRMFNDKMADCYYYLLEVLSRQECDEVDLQEARDAVAIYEIDKRNKIEYELKELGYYSVEVNQYKVMYDNVMLELVNVVEVK